MSKKCSDYWLGYLAMTIAKAQHSEHPKRILKSALQKFMQSPAADHMRANLVKELSDDRARADRPAGRCKSGA